MDTREIESTQDLAKSPFMDRIHERWSAFQASPVRVFLLALACAFFFCTITELTWVKADLNDDYTIASVLSGRLMGDDQGLCLFLNAIMCNIIYAYADLFPMRGTIYLISWAESFFCPLARYGATSWHGFVYLFSVLPPSPSSYECTLRELPLPRQLRAYGRSSWPLSLDSA